MKRDLASFDTPVNSENKKIAPLRTFAALRKNSGE
jgi:hypothetical protein